MNWLKNFSDKLFNKQKNLGNVFIILIIGIMILVAGGSIFKTDNKKNISSSNVSQNNIQAVDKIEFDYSQSIERKLENILSEIEGVGKTSVMITFYSGSEIVPAKDSKEKRNVTEESDTQGGTRKINESDTESSVLVLNERNGEQKPLVIKEIHPKVKGVIVVAEGACDLKVKYDITNAVKTVLGVGSHQVKVFEKIKK